MLQSANYVHRKLSANENPRRGCGRWPIACYPGQCLIAHPRYVNYSDITKQNEWSIGFDCTVSMCGMSYPPKVGLALFCFGKKVEVVGKKGVSCLFGFCMIGGKSPGAF